MRERRKDVTFHPIRNPFEYELCRQFSTTTESCWTRSRQNGAGLYCVRTSCSISRFSVNTCTKRRTITGRRTDGWKRRNDGRSCLLLTTTRRWRIPTRATSWAQGQHETWAAEAVAPSIIPFRLWDVQFNKPLSGAYWIRLWDVQ